jgi:molybdate transport system substrate-binding protein
MTLSGFRDAGALVLFILCAGCARQGATQKVTVAAAADLQFALPATVRAFQAGNQGIRISAVYGSSGNFYSQIANGAPFDVFLSADMEYPRKLAQQGLALPDSLFMYGVGRLAVWVPNESGLDVHKLQMRTLESDSVQHVAIANPQHAPYGKAAEAALRSLGVYDRVKPKLVFGENIAQTLEFVQSGAAQAGIVALSLAMAPAVRGQGSYWEIPLDAYPRLEQGGAILQRARDSQAAARFREFLLQPAGRGILKQYGFYLPEGH